jgi:hypothetical protein
MRSFWWRGRGGGQERVDVSVEDANSHVREIEVQTAKRSSEHASQAETT